MLYEIIKFKENWVSGFKANVHVLGRQLWVTLAM